jgi:eukaryotic-like serine/threonine-protein kinase
MPNESSPPEKSATANEEQRLDAVRCYDILDTPPNGAFDHITALAAQLLRMPVAIISIVDHDRIWFKSRHGLHIEQLGRPAKSTSTRFPF